MRSSAVIALALVAAAGPAFAAPVAPSTGNFARANTNRPSTSSSTDVSSEAISLSAVSTIASVAAPLVGGIIDYFKNRYATTTPVLRSQSDHDLFFRGNQKQRRDALELESLLARAEASGDDSNAISLGAISTIASFAAPLVGGIIDHFKNKDKRADFEELFARAADDDASEAVRLGTVADVASIGSSLLSAFQGLWSRDDAMELLARASEDEISGALFDGLRHHYAPGTFHIMRSDDSEDASEAIKLGNVANIAGIGSSLVSMFHNIFGREDTMELLARASGDDDLSGALSTLMRLQPGRFDTHFPVPVRFPRPQLARADVDGDAAQDSEAIRLGQVADIASIGSSVVSAWHSIFGREDLIARADPDQDSEAIRLGQVADIASIGSSVVSAWHSIFGRDDAIMGVLARADFADDDSAAIVLRPGMQSIRVPTSLNGLKFHIGRADADAESAALFLNGLHHLGNLGPAQWGIKRDVLELLARADTTDESDAIKLSTLGSIAGIGGSVISAIHNLFSG